MSDLQIFKNMLDRAKIQHSESHVAGTKRITISVDQGYTYDEAEFYFHSDDGRMLSYSEPEEWQK